LDAGFELKSEPGLRLHLPGGNLAGQAIVVENRVTVIDSTRRNDEIKGAS
jgi:hypothetical protein